MILNRTTILAAFVTLGLAPAASAQTVPDPRTVVTLPAPVAEAFRAEMRGHMRSLDDVIFELAEGNYDAAAALAEVRWDFGHRMWEAMEEQGMTPEQIARAKQQVQEAMGGPGMMERGMGRGQGAGMGRGMGFGRFMPEAFRMMGQGFHEAGQRFADTARAMGDDPDAAAVSGLLSSLQEVTATCRACHDVFRIVAEGE
ncbi:cytochrome c [Rhodospira trueperi]|uniref:Cytochrome C n=1 Tax=Rhodospira trueperi TaxID=69960 RepID=A0A1G6ZT91_9PROT|nr:cytochrome c [Rhodospira trueperi]SDE05741.1 Cytochrome C' [Rhodospira trueperi]